MAEVVDATQGERVAGGNDWIEQCLSQAQKKAVEGGRPVPEKVVQGFRSLMNTRFQQVLRNDDLRQAVVELATANSTPDAPREG
jgi:hypothetical protein